MHFSSYGHFQSHTSRHTPKPRYGELLPKQPLESWTQILDNNRHNVICRKDIVNYLIIPVEPLIIVQQNVSFNGMFQYDKRIDIFPVFDCERDN